MGKRNKIRYQTKPKDLPLILLTGNVYLQYEDEKGMAQARKGDLLVYPYEESLNTNRQGDYRSTGFSGYFKVDVHDGKEWCPVIISGIFLQREHYFSKSEYPLDTYHQCAELLRAMAGKNLRRAYREHYEPEE